MLFVCPGFVFAQDDTSAQDEISFYELEEQLMVTATKRKISVRKAPAIATVITADEIKNMGARDLTDVLKTVPGFGVSISDTGSYMFEVRGVRTNYSEKIVVMIDGHRVYDSYYGSALYHLFDDLSVGKIRQIEIIRGPGSALYGANAFVGVINVITKDADGIGISVAGGSFDTKKVGILGGKSSGELKIFGSFDHSDTEGADVTIEADSIAGEPYSMTPGDADLGVERTDAFLKIASGNLTLRGHFVKRDEGLFIGFTNILTDENFRKYEYFWTELDYSESFTDNLSVSFRTYFDYFKFEHYLELLTEGMPGHPDGAIGVPSLKNKVFGTELQFDLDISETNHLIFGLSFDHIDQYDVKYIADYYPLTMEPIGRFQDVSEWNYCKNITRQIWAAYIQDEWTIRENLNLTAGVRYDYYDDFGSTVNPRAGLVWNFLENADLKLLYGQAFRAPNYVELYTINNPVAIGSEDIEPETIRTYEAGVGYRFGNFHMAYINYFHSDIDDQIVYDYSTSPAKFANRGSQKIDGIEVVLNGKYSLANYWQLTYTWQNPEDADTGEELPYVPSHRAAFSVNWELCKYLNAHTDVLWTGKRPRVSGDDRGDMPSYTTVDLTLIAKNFWKNLEVRGMIHNLLDEEYEDPDLSGAQKLIPYDYPREGISALIELSYKF